MPEQVLDKRLYVVCRAGTSEERWISLYPWATFLEDTEQLLCFNGLHRSSAEYLDYASGRLLRGAELEAAQPGLAADIREAQAQVPPLRGRFLYLIWREPWMAAGPDTFISRLLEDLGLENAARGEQRYPVVDPFAVQADVVLLSSEPFPFKARHLAELQDAARSVRLIDGEACSWHGSAMLRGFRELARWAGDPGAEVDPLGA